MVSDTTMPRSALTSLSHGCSMLFGLCQVIISYLQVSTAQDQCTTDCLYVLLNFFLIDGMWQGVKINFVTYYLKPLVLFSRFLYLEYRLLFIIACIDFLYFWFERLSAARFRESLIKTIPAKFEKHPCLNPILQF